MTGGDGEVSRSLTLDALENQVFDYFIYYYFIEKWLDNYDIPVELWNCHNKRHRTTNAVEGWNNRLNNMFRKPNPKLKDLIQCFKTVAENASCAYMRIMLNLGGKRRKYAYMKLDNRID